MKKGGAKKYGFSDSQFFAVIVAAMLGGGITTLPRDAAEMAGRDGWLSIGLAGLGALIAGMLIYALCRRFPNRTLPEFSILILGKPLGIALTIMYSTYALLVAASALRIFSELTKTWTMLWTPMWVFFIGVLLSAVYIARVGAVTMGRLMELILMLTILPVLMFILPAGEINPINLLPVAGEGLAAIAGGAPSAALSYLGFEVLLVFFPFVINRGKLLRVYLLAIGAVAVFYVTNAMLLYGVLGVEQTTLQVWPLMNYLRIGALPLLERLDNLVLFIWTGQIIAVVAIQYYAATFSMAVATGRKGHDTWALLTWPVVYLLATLPNSLPKVFAASKLVGSGGIVFIVALTLLLLLVAMIRGLDESKEGGTKNV